MDPKEMEISSSNLLLGEGKQSGNHNQTKREVLSSVDLLIIA